MSSFPGDSISYSRLDSQLKDDLLLLLQVLLTDTVPSVLSSALSTWLHVCPERTDLLHRPYRQICRSLVEMDEWGQLVTIRVLSIYVRRCFRKPEEPVQQQSTSQFYDDISNTELDLDPDLILFYKCSLQLCHSRSSAVSPDT
jgi:AP-3 complex subunit beta